MAIMIRGIRLDNVGLSREDDGNYKLTGQYSLMSEADKVLAKQGFNGYENIALSPSADTVDALNKFLAGVKSDLEKILGIGG